MDADPTGDLRGGPVQADGVPSDPRPPGLVPHMLGLVGAVVVGLGGLVLAIASMIDDRSTAGAVVGIVAFGYGSVMAVGHWRAYRRRLSKLRSVGGQDG